MSRVTLKHSPALPTKTEAIAAAEVVTASKLEADPTVKTERPFEVSTAATSGPEPFAPVPNRQLHALSELLELPPLPPRARRLPESDPLAAVMNPLFDQLQPAIKQLAAARRVLVIGHGEPIDGDDLGSVSGAVAALQAMGKFAMGVADGERSLALQKFGEGVGRAADVAGVEFDLVLVVDVAQDFRIGAMAPWVHAADNLLVVDHHLVPDPRESLGVKPGARFNAVIQPAWGSAAALLRFLVEHTAEEVGVSPRVVAQASAEKLATGEYTDNLAFRVSGATEHAARLFNYDVEEFGLDLGAMEQLLNPPISDAVVKLLDEAVGLETVDTGVGPEPVFALSYETLRKAADLLRPLYPGVTDTDVENLVIARLDAAEEQQGVHRAALVIEHHDGTVEVKVRSDESLRDGDAKAVAAAIGPGGGKAGSAVANLGEMDFEDAVQRVKDVLTREGARAAGRDPFGGMVR